MDKPLSVFPKGAGSMTAEKTSGRQMSDTFRAAAFIILSGGFQDAYTYFCRGEVFANAQTGNIVLMSTAFFRSEWGTVLKCLIPVCSFLIGTAVAELIHVRLRKCEKIHWRQIILAVEIVILFAVGFLPHSVDPARERARLVRLRDASSDLPQGPRARLRQHDVHRQYALRNRVLLRVRQNREQGGAPQGGDIFLGDTGLRDRRGIGSAAVATLGDRSILICCASLAVSFFMMFREKV